MSTLLKFLVSASAAGAFLISSASAFADTQTFMKPKQGGNRLDWCLDWSTGCGAPAADAWCQTKRSDAPSACTQFHS